MIPVGFRDVWDAQWDGLRGWMGSQTLRWIRPRIRSLMEKGFSHVFLMEKCSTIPFPGTAGLELLHPSGLVPAQVLTGNDHSLDLCCALVDLQGKPEIGEPAAGKVFDQSLHTCDPSLCQARWQEEGKLGKITVTMTCKRQ